MSKFSAVTAELEAIASCELESELPALRAGTLTDDQRLTVVAYLRAELQPFGMLDLAHLNASGNQTPAQSRTINRQARALLAKLDA